MPDSCPALEVGSAACVLAVHHRRERKTGPCFPLTVVVCRVHGRAFTLYPPGYAPYRREAVLDLAPDGSTIKREPSASALADFERTVFEAALSARRGEAWSRSSWQGSGDRWWTTELRHLKLTTRVLGMSEELTERTKAEIAEVLMVPQLVLREAAQRITGYRSRGVSICGILRLVQRGARGALRLLECGHLSGAWGEPWHWDVHRQILHPPAFRPPDTGRPP